VKQLFPRISTAVAIICGWVTLLGLFLPSQLVADFPVHLLLIRAAATLAAAAFLLGILNLLGVHFRRIGRQERDWGYSIFLILSFLGVIGAAALAPVYGEPVLEGTALRWVFHSILSPLEAAAASLLVFFLVAAAFRVMRKRPTLSTLVFVLTIILVLLGAMPLPGQLGLTLAEARDWLVHVFAMAGARGMLLGVALGTIATGLRVLIGFDRPHSEREP
jgi:hypothetical protein